MPICLRALLPHPTQGVTEDQVYGVWSQSGLEWSTHLHVPPEDLGYLLEDHVSSTAPPPQNMCMIWYPHWYPSLWILLRVAAYMEV